MALPAPVWPLLSSEQMRRLDRHTIRSLGIPEVILMESAGQSVAAEALQLGAAERAQVLVACGPGNNGGDGLVAARRLHGLGVPVQVWPLFGARRLKASAAAAYRRARKAGVPFVSGRPRIKPGALIIDALLGTGLSRAPQGELQAAIRRMLRARDAGARVLAVDIPSGLDADTGQTPGLCVRAHRTLTLALPKLGLALPPGRELSGRIRVARIGIADQAPGQTEPAELWTRARVALALPPRPADAHKGVFGHVLGVAGSRGKLGAAELLAKGAMRAGAGLVTAACAGSLEPLLAAKLTEAMTEPLPENAEGALALAAFERIMELAETRDVLVFGPGLSRAKETAKLVRRVSLEAPAPLVLDADGLLAFKGALHELAARRAPTVLTPHPGEASALLGISAAEINKDRVSAARLLSQQSGAVVVLKGAATVIAQPGGRICINPTGGALLAAGGSGDLLAGALGALLAQGLRAGGGDIGVGVGGDMGVGVGGDMGAGEAKVFELTAAAVFLHGAAADRLSRQRASAGLPAGEVALELPGVMEALRRVRAPAVFGAGDVLDFPEPG